METRMSLTVPEEMVEQAERGPIDKVAFIDVIKNSLPRAWSVVDSLLQRKLSGEPGVVSFGQGTMDSETRGELLRMMAGTAIRTSLEKHFGVKFAFQNCHNVAVVKDGEENAWEFQEFTSVEAQVRNQAPKPEFQHC
jgi:hypothetical protein